MEDDTPGLSRKIIIYPDFEKMKMDVEKLRTELTMLVLERDDLLYQECKNIEMAYMLSIGGLEYKAYELECSILRLKRKMDLIQAKKNRQEKIVLSKIEKVLDAEFAEYQTKLNEQIEKMNSAIERSHRQFLTDEETREIKKLYRSIVKILHPDMHPDLSEARIRLFQNASEAYEQSDLNGLRIISEMIADSELSDNKSDGLTYLVKEKERLIKLLQSIKDRIVEIKSEYPYTLKSFLQSPKKIADRKAELEATIKQLRELADTYTAKITEMLR